MAMVPTMAVAFAAATAWRYAMVVVLYRDVALQKAGRLCGMPSSWLLYRDVAFQKAEPRCDMPWSWCCTEMWHYRKQGIFAVCLRRGCCTEMWHTRKPNVVAAGEEEPESHCSKLQEDTGDKYDGNLHDNKGKNLAHTGKYADEWAIEG